MEMSKDESREMQTKMRSDMDPSQHKEVEDISDRSTGGSGIVVPAKLLEHRLYNSDE